MTHQLTGEEIKNLLFGAKTTGIDLFSGRQWWIDRKTNGECTWRGPGPIPFDTGKSRIEGDMICNQFQKGYGKLKFAGLFSEIPEARTKVKMSMSSAGTRELVHCQ